MEKSNLVIANIFSIRQWEDSSYPLQLRRARYLVLVCHAPSKTENFRSPHEEVADTWLYTVYLKKRFITKLLNMFRLKRTGKINGSQVLKEFKLAN